MCEELLRENDGRLQAVESPYDPLKGDAEDPARFHFKVNGLREAWIPLSMLRNPQVNAICNSGTAKRFRPVSQESFDLIRCLHDFPFWAASYVRIKPKGGGVDVPFYLNPPQRRLVATLEKMRDNGKPIRLILLKARQWGASTCVQVYMAWLQLVHQKGLNSLIIAHYNIASVEIKDMFDRLLANYPENMLLNGCHDSKEGRRSSKVKTKNSKLTERVGSSSALFRIIPRDCKIKVATAESPDSSRGGDYNLVHCSEVGLWKSTRLKTPEQILRSACSGVLFKPMTMIVYESTANGTGNFFHSEYVAAKKGVSQFMPLFVPWFEIPQYSLEFPPGEKYHFAKELLLNRANDNVVLSRNLSGKYLWSLWEKGATLEAIHWYVMESAKYPDHALMAAEYPSDDIEAFAHSGYKVFDINDIELMREECSAPVAKGEISGESSYGPDSLLNVRFVPDVKGHLSVWSHPEKDRWMKYCDRYLVVMDVGGRSEKSDWSVIAVFDRLPDSQKKCKVVAQWRGHADFDLLAWNAARIAQYYHNALLVIESNSVETRSTHFSIEGDQTPYIFRLLHKAYRKLYIRSGNTENPLSCQPRYGFHTNVATKPMIVSALVMAVRERLYEESDEECLAELAAYEHLPNGSYGALHGHHDDILMTRAIALYLIMNELSPPDCIERLTDHYGREIAPYIPPESNGPFYTDYF